MAKQTTWLQRGLQHLSAGFKALSTGEGASTAARLGQSIKETKAKLKSMLGLEAGRDAFETSAGPDRRRAAQRLIGGGEMAFVPRSGMRTRDLNATVGSEFRGQLTAGLAAASSRAVGSTLADAPGWEDSDVAAA